MHIFIRIFLDNATTIGSNVFGLMTSESDNNCVVLASDQSQNVLPLDKVNNN